MKKVFAPVVAIVVVAAGCNSETSGTEEVGTAGTPVGAESVEETNGAAVAAKSEENSEIQVSPELLGQALPAAGDLPGDWSLAQPTNIDPPAYPQFGTSVKPDECDELFEKLESMRAEPLGHASAGFEKTTDAYNIYLWEVIETYDTDAGEIVEALTELVHSCSSVTVHDSESGTLVNNLDLSPVSHEDGDFAQLGDASATMRQELNRTS